MKSVTITFLPDGQSSTTREGRRVLGAVLEAERPIGYSCRGLGVCVACVVWVCGPQSPIGEAEARLLDQIDGPLTRGQARLRVACLAEIEGDVTLQADYW